MCEAKHVEMIFANLYSPRDGEFINAIRSEPNKYNYVAVAGGVVCKEDERMSPYLGTFTTVVENGRLPGAEKKVLVITGCMGVQPEAIGAAVNSGAIGIIFFDDGFDREQWRQIKDAAKKIPCIEIIRSPLVAAQAAFSIPNYRLRPGLYWKR